MQNRIPVEEHLARIRALLPRVSRTPPEMVPLAAAIYLVVTVSWTLGQRLVLRRIYPLPS